MPQPGVVRDPAASMPAPVPGAFRRLTQVLASPPAAVPDGPAIVVSAACLDTVASGERHRADLRAALARDGVVMSAAVDGQDLDDVVGLRVGPGSRGTLARLVSAGSTSRATVLLDLPVAVALSSYAAVQSRRARLPEGAPATDPSAIDRFADSCAGWARDGVIVRGIEEGTYEPPSPPPVPSAPAGNGWPGLAEIPTGWMRRHRLLDVLRRSDGSVMVRAGFRDVWCDLDGVARVLHEWELDLDVDEGLQIRSVSATPRALPFAACPTVAPALRHLDGVPLNALRAAVRDRLGGVVGCTHLNDLLAAVPATVEAA